MGGATILSCKNRIAKERGEIFLSMFSHALMNKSGKACFTLLLHDLKRWISSWTRGSFRGGLVSLREYGVPPEHPDENQWSSRHVGRCRLLAIAQASWTNHLYSSQAPIVGNICWFVHLVVSNISDIWCWKLLVHALMSGEALACSRRWRRTVDPSSVQCLSSQCENGVRTALWYQGLPLHSFLPHV